MTTFRQSQIVRNLALRAEIIRAIREFFQENEFLEVETPLRIPAPAPEPHIHACPADNWYLHTSPELCMKRLLAAGYPKIFQICKCFRQKERGRRHLEEFTMLEWYESGITYNELMAQTGALIDFVRRRVGLGNVIPYQGRRITLSQSWPKITVAAAFEQYGSMDMKAALAADRFEEVLAFDIEPHLGIDRPVFLHDYPAAFNTLAALIPGRSDLSQRFELYMGGVEICNGFTELTDAAEQRRRFIQESDAMEKTGQIAYPLPERFLQDLAFMPPAAGNALGIDRLAMIFCDKAAIDDVVAFTPEEL
ncbi:MAG: EF-P lysine aminoacylase GenX [Desulfobacteraceae bacterium]|jgi:lysyl-tRNA synthetase class 2|nr:MAG: EF-P lysine aminoacylase GenX [Desulfobacteraceae bacterium]